MAWAARYTTQLAMAAMKSCQGLYKNRSKTDFPSVSAGVLGRPTDTAQHEFGDLNNTALSGLAFTL